MERYVSSIDDVLRMLDDLFGEADRWTAASSGWWDGFYRDRARPVPFFRDVPDESLVAWHAEGLMPARGRALDLGCGPGRNAIWLAAHGLAVDAVDVSAEAIRWGRERAATAGVDVNFVHGSIFDLDELGAYDIVYDSGCFHHLPPHRRPSYRRLLERAIAPGGTFGLVCFAWGEMGSQSPDDELYREGRLSGGLAYRADDLLRFFGWMRPVELRRMAPQPSSSPTFGEAFLWVGLFEAPVSG